CVDFSLFKPNIINMNVHSATCSCSIELYKHWYSLADFFPNWNISRAFLYISLIRRTVRISEAATDRGFYIFRMPRSSFMGTIAQ
ncbi:MAG: hypothetical protein ACK56I_17380, partial [bacterium]